MKKFLCVSIGSLIFLTISSLVGFFTKYLPVSEVYIPVLIGLGLMAISGVLAIIFKRSKISSIIGLLLNAVGLGFAIRSWYLYRGFDNSIVVMILVSLACFAYLWLYLLFLFIPFIYDNRKLYTGIYIFLSIVAYICLIALTKTTFLSTFGYYLIIQCSFILGLVLGFDDSSRFLRDMHLCSLSVIVVAIIILVLILAGEGGDFDLDFLDFSGAGGGTTKKKKVKNL